MFESTLAHLGRYLAEKSEIQSSQIIYAERELVFHYLSLNNLPVSLPAIAYSAVDFLDPQELRPLKGKGAYNLNYTKAERLELIPINLSINIGFISDNLKDYLNFLKTYWLLVSKREFIVNYNGVNPYIENEQIELTYNCQLNNFSSLSTPPSGKEGKDYDRGKFYISEGSFEVNSYAVFSEMYTIVREINVSCNWGNIQILGG